MSDSSAYRSRVTTVRGRARAQLAAIRKDRLARKRATLGADGASRSDDGLYEFVRSGSSHVSGEEAAAEPAAALQEPEAPGASRDWTETAVREDEAVPPGSSSVADSEAIGSGAVAAQAAAFGAEAPPALSDPPPPPVMPGEPGPAPAAEKEDGADGGDPECESRCGAVSAGGAGSDLSRIPGIGAGLVWMLETAGVSSLDDLARADPADLAGRLGVISRLLDLDYLVAQARGLGPADSTVPPSGQMRTDALEAMVSPPTAGCRFGRPAGRPAGRRGPES